LYSRTGHSDDMAHAHCMLDTEVYECTLKIINTYCFSTATMVARTHLNVTLHLHCLLCYDSKYVSFWHNIFSKYRVIHKSLRDFRTRLRNNQDRHGRKEHM